MPTVMPNHKELQGRGSVVLVRLLAALNSSVVHALRVNTPKLQQMRCLLAVCGQQLPQGRPHQGQTMLPARRRYTHALLLTPRRGWFAQVGGTHMGTLLRPIHLLEQGIPSAVKAVPK